jgi:hypothetical protein
MWDNALYISPKYTREDYSCLHLNTQSSASKWDLAIKILEDRIQGRFLNAIDRLKSTDCEIFGAEFSIMAIACLLIETLQQFYLGVKATPQPNIKAFISFFLTSEHFKEDFRERSAKIFYEDIRCGILHQAQTKRNSQLTRTGNEMVLEIENGIRVNVDMFCMSLNCEFTDYITKLKSGDFETRIKFIKKMKYIIATE